MGYANYLKLQGTAGIAVEIRVEGDAFWSYVGTKAQQRWTWYVLERATGMILAHHNGRRTDEACQALLKQLDIFPIQTYYTDNWPSYAKFIPQDKHVIGTADTWKIERTNLNFRTHLKRLQRKTICFSRKEALHDTIIGLYIEHEYYRHMDAYRQIA